MNCHDTRERLLDHRATAAIRRHLARCDDCGHFSREIETGGREIAEAFLATAPSPGFEERVAARIEERELSAATTPSRVLVRLLAPALFSLLIVAGYLLFTQEPPSPDQAPKVTVAKTEVVTTEPERENPLYVMILRDALAEPTRLELSFAGQAWAVDLAADPEREFLLAWARGARDAELVIGPEVPGREITVMLDILERVGFSYRLRRLKH